jgi:hypothetical protein
VTLPLVSKAEPAPRKGKLTNEQLEHCVDSGRSVSFRTCFFYRCVAEFSYLDFGLWPLGFDERNARKQRTLVTV